MSLHWFKSYLKNRKQIIKINDITGEEMRINCGVPQSSVIGPIMIDHWFSFYT